MTKVLLFFIFLNFNYCAAQSDSIILNACYEWNLTDSIITAGTISKEKAIKDILRLSNKIIKRTEITLNGTLRNNIPFNFPLQNFGNIDSIRFFMNGDDYNDENYDYFQGSNSIGHPAHDIIINDRDKDLNDDITGKPVDVVSVSGGIVIAINNSWKAGSLLRGGKYVKIFDPAKNSIYYYSHLSSVTVYPGTLIESGMKIGEVGRTGRKAVLKEGSTHLHISYLKIEEGYPFPQDFFSELIRSYTKIKLTRTK
ncbi:hypothetical protein BH10BAC5_BH10BAC5_07890 [soil metagenome]